MSFQTQRAVVMCDHCHVLCAEQYRPFGPPGRRHFRCPHCQVQVSILGSGEDPRAFQAYSQLSAATNGPHSGVHYGAHGANTTGNNGYTQIPGLRGYGQATSPTHTEYPYHLPFNNPYAPRAGGNAGDHMNVSHVSIPGYATPRNDYGSSHAQQYNGSSTGAAYNLYNSPYDVYANPFSPQQGQSPHVPSNLRETQQQRAEGEAPEAPMDGEHDVSRTTPPGSHTSGHSRQHSDYSATISGETTEDEQTDASASDSDNADASDDIPPVAFTTQGETLLLGEEFIVPTAEEAHREAGARVGPARVFSRHETVGPQGNRILVEIEENVEEADLTMSGARQ